MHIIWRGPDALGEGPMWHVTEQALYWIDIVQHLLHRLDPKQNTHHVWTMPDVIGSVVPRAAGGVVVTVGHRVLAVDIPSGHMHEIAQIAPWSQSMRMNDGKCDALGRFWIGVADARDVDKPVGGLYRLDSNGQITQMEKEITISNGLGWSPDHRKFYYTDGLRYRIYQYDFDLATGTISNRSVFLQLDKSPIEPDGLTVDEEGYIWQAQWNSGKIFRYSPQGHLDRTIEIPVQRPTSCIFGGTHLDTLYVTSCAQAFGEHKPLPAPAGSVFAIHVGVKGLPEPAFAG